MADRSSFIGDLRTALGVASASERKAEQFPSLFSSPDNSKTLEAIHNRSAGERKKLFQRFQEIGTEIRLQIHYAADYDAAAGIIVEIARNAEPEFSKEKQIIQHDCIELAQLGLADKLSGDGVIVHTVVPDDPSAREKVIASYIGITTADWGIAESATVVQLTRPGKSRSTSLVPSIHIALLPIERILADLKELQALLDGNPPESSYVLISGPSKTGDIESYIVFGAHGPRDMHVVVLTAGNND